MGDNSVLWKLIDSAREIVVIFNAQGYITYSNKEAEDKLQYSDGLKNHHINEIFPNEFENPIGAIIETNIETSAYRANRTCFEVDLRVMKMEDEYVCLAIDVTQQNYFEKKASQSDTQAEEAEQVKTQFVANVTHELRTPVNGILGNTRELLEVEEDEKKLKTLKLIERGCRDMHAIINNILDFSKLDSGKFVLEQNRFSLWDMVEYIRSTHASKINEKGLQFSVTVSPDIPKTIIGDELRLQQILNNLISNAVKFTYTGKIMVEIVKTAQIGNKVELFFMVIDTGIGIAKEDQDKLFKSFSQVEASTTRKFGGTGLGLNISKQLVEMMNGNIHVESEKGKGSMFSFHIWAEVPEEEAINNSMEMQSFNVKLPTLDSSLSETSVMLEFGTKKNIEEIQKKLSKLILCVDMENWEKAEFFMDSIKQLTAEAPREIKSAVLKLKMAVQRADGEKTSEAHDAMIKLLPQG